jgi:hypothetical protein
MFGKAEKSYKLLLDSFTFSGRLCGIQCQFKFDKSIIGSE